MNNLIKFNHLTLNTLYLKFNQPIRHMTLACFALFISQQQAHAANSTSSSNFWSKSSCVSQFYKDTPPYLVKDSLKKNTTPICFNGFNVMYSGMSKTPLWSAEHLTVQRLSVKIKRQDSFHEEERLNTTSRSTLKDYRASGYDRGHMSPNADMPDEASQYDSFSLANMVPQAPKNNQEVWRKLEEATRAVVTKQKQNVYVVTGPVYSNQKLKTVGNGVLVPSSVFKAVYYPETGVAGAYYAPNDNSLKVKVVSICEIEDLTGVNLFPALSESVKRRVYDLPLSTTDVKPAKKYAFSNLDSKSQCANEVSEADLNALKKQFTAPGRPNSNGATDSFVGSNIVQMLKQVVENLLAFVLKLVKAS